MNKLIVLTFLFIPFGFLVNYSSNHSEKSLNNRFQKTKYPGEKVFKKYCITCHQADGGGVPHLNPPLINTPYVLGEKDELIRIVLNGLKNVTIDDETYSNPMPSFKKILKDQEIADVLTYVRNSFGNKASAVTISEVKEVRSKLK